MRAFPPPQRGRRATTNANRVNAGTQGTEPIRETLVIGGGIVGLSVSWFLAEAGMDVLCLDAGRDSGSATNAGSLHGQMQSRMERLFPERIEDYRHTLPIYPRAIDYWAGIAGRLGEDIEFAIGGGLMIAESAGQMAALERKSRIEGEHGVRTRPVGREELLSIAPCLNPSVHGALFCEKEGKINPLLAADAVRRRAEAAGAALRSGTAQRLERGGAGYLVAAGRATYRAQRVVIAAGAGSGRLAATLGLRLPCTAEPLQMCITEPAEPLMHHLIQHAAQAITMKQLANGQVLIGGGWPAARPRNRLPPAVLSESLAGNLRLARHLVPAIGGLQVQRTWAGVNTLVDLVSVLGPAESLPGLYFAVPGDAGFTLGPYCARLVADAILGHSPDYPLDRFSIARFRKS